MTDSKARKRNSGVAKPKSEADEISDETLDEVHGGASKPTIGQTSTSSTSPRSRPTSPITRFDKDLTPP